MMPNTTDEIYGRHKSFCRLCKIQFKCETKYGEDIHVRHYHMDNLVFEAVQKYIKITLDPKFKYKAHCSICDKDFKYPASLHMKYFHMESLIQRDIARYIDVNVKTSSAILEENERLR